MPGVFAEKTWKLLTSLACKFSRRRNFFEITFHQLMIPTRLQDYRSRNYRLRETELFWKALCTEGQNLSLPSEGWSIICGLTHFWVAGKLCKYNLNSPVSWPLPMFHTVFVHKGDFLLKEQIDLIFVLQKLLLCKSNLQAFRTLFFSSGVRELYLSCSDIFFCFCDKRPPKVA